MSSLKHALTVLMFALSTQAFGNPTLIENVHGYTLTGDRLQPFSSLAFNLGKVRWDLAARTGGPAAAPGAWSVRAAQRPHAA
jgi:hypothetical protein